MRYFRKTSQTRRAILPMIALCLALLAGCAAPAVLTTDVPDAPVSRTGFYFDTVVQIALYGISQDEADRLLDGCFDLAYRYDERLLSAYNGRSQLYLLNHADEPCGSYRESGDQTWLDPEVVSLLDTALSWQERTDSAFHPTLGTLTALWNFGGDPPGPVPDQAAIADALKHLAPNDPAAMFDLGGIAKGYVADRLKAYLKENGAESAVINLGGNVLLVGSKPDGSDFKVGIQDPDAGIPAALSGKTVLTVEASDLSIVTSGVYERYFEEDGVRYHHVLDPATGYPADAGLSSVTILSTDSTTGDALATACLVLGEEKGRTLIENMPDVEALFIAESGEMTFTAGFPHSSPN